jgi:ribonuclease P protein component
VAEHPHTFPRAQRLKRRRLIRPLFSRAEDVGRVSEGVVQLRYRLVPRDATDAPVQVGFAPGRRARTNVGRTRLRRLMRETYRLHQHGLRALFATRPDSLTAFVLFRGHEATAAEDLRRDLPRALRRLETRLREAPPRSADPPPA